jgi:hypothetical protein
MNAVIRAKVRISQVTKCDGGHEIVEANAIYANGGNENASFSKFTPQLSLRMQIDNPAAQGVLRPGEEFYLDFTRVPVA